MRLFVSALARVVESFPRMVVGAALAVTLALGFAIPLTVEGDTFESFAPHSPEFRALETLSAQLGGSDTRVQVILSSPGGDVVTADGLQSVIAVEEAIRSTEAARYLTAVDGNEIVSFLEPLIAGLEWQGISAWVLQDEHVKEGYSMALDALPADQAAQLAGMLSSSGTDPAGPSSSAGLLVAYLALPADMDVRDVVSIVRSVTDSVGDAAVGDVEALGFAPELFMDVEVLERHVGDLLGRAAIIILVILGFVMWVRPSGRLSRRGALRRSAADVAITFSAIGMAVVWVMGAGGLLGPGGLDLIGPASPISRMVPILLLGLGVDYAIHLMARYREEAAAGSSVGRSAGRATRTVGIALMLGAVTTAVGFATNLANPVPALQDFGVLSALGILGAFLLMSTFVPSVRLLLDRRAERRSRLPTGAFRSHGVGAFGRLAGFTSVLAERHSLAVVVGAFVLAGAGAFGLTQLDTAFGLTDFVPGDDPALAAQDRLEDEFGGGFGEVTHWLLEGDVATPEVHNLLVALPDSLAGIDGIGTIGPRAQVQSSASVIAGLTDPLLNGGIDRGFADFAAANGLLPDLTMAPDANVRAIYYRAFEIAPNEMASVIAIGADGEFRYADVAVTTSVGVDGASDLVARLADQTAILAAEVDDAQITSDSIIVDMVQSSLSASQAQSLVITLLTVALLMTISFGIRERQPILGLISIVPVALVVLWTYGMMAALSIPFGPATATVAALSVGIGIDYSIHVVHRYLEDRERFETVVDAVRSTVAHTGGALIGSAATTMAGFGILITSTLDPFRQLGGVIVIAVGFSVASSVVVIPSMLVMWDRQKRSGGVAMADIEPGEGEQEAVT